ncbi:MAG: TIR domain-containing protein [Clostridia bacterium]|nr:TIR domain-containing protein [Clostridia bacterium]
MLHEHDNLAECEYCGSVQTVPSVDDEKKAKEFNRANQLRMQKMFDRAASMYEKLIVDYPKEAEGYWGLCLCDYGIEYVEDPYSGDKKPTCHRAMFTSLTEDENYKQALNCADEVAKNKYRSEAQEIDRINQRILEIGRTEKPYDIFICYKETDHDQRTQDSLLAEDIYDALTQKGYKVFFAHVSLKERLSVEYEPFIFAALNSARVMITVSTKPEYIQAPWVRNEWSRFLRLKAKDPKKELIPCVKDMKPDDLPPELNKGQAQRIGEIGVMRDMIRGIDSFFPEKKGAAYASGPATPTAKNIAELGTYSLDDEKWEDANKKFDEALRMEPKNAEANLGKFLVRKNAKNIHSYYERIVNNASEVQPETVDIIDSSIKDQHQQIISSIEVPDFFDKATIEGYLKKIPSTYSSTLGPMRQYYEKQMDDLHSSGDYMRAVKFASDSLSQYLLQEEETFKTNLQAAIDHAEANDRQDRTAAVAAYQENLSKVQAKLAEARQKVLGILNEKYNAAGMKQANAHSHSELVQAQKEFEALKSFKDSKQRAQQVKAQADAAYNNANMRYTQAYPLLQQREQVTTRLEATRRSLGGLNSDETKRKMWLILAGGFFIFDLLVFVISGGFSDIDGIGDFLVLLIGFVIGSAIGGLVFRPVLRTIRRAQLMVKERKDAKLMAQIESIPPFRADDFRF